MKRRLDLKGETRRSFRNSFKLGKVKKWYRFATFISSVACPRECVNVDALKRLVLQRLRVHFQIAANDRQFAFSPRTSERMH